MKHTDSASFKLLHVFSSPMSPYYFMEGQLQYMMSRGVEAHIVIPKDTFYLPKIKERDENVKIHHIPLERKIYPFRDFQSLISLILIIVKIKPDIIHLHTPKASFLGALASRLLFRKNIIYHMHGLISSRGNKIDKGLMFYLEKLTCKLSHKVLAVSPSLQRLAIENSICSASKIKVIGKGSINGIDTNERFNPENVVSTQFSYLRDSGKFVIGFIGRLNEDKGITDFLDVVSSLSTSNNILGVIVGPNEMGGEYENLVKSYKTLSSDNLLLLDEITHPEKILKSFDVLLFPSRREGFGLVAAEASSMEVPVVAYKITGIMDVIEDGVTGKLVDYMDTVGLVNAIQSYIDKPEEKVLHGAQGRIRIQKLYTREQLWHELFAMYNTLITDINSAHVVSS
ncbi:glycosyltransferase [Robertkochia flava]|uniref:glycosyltransferase n=1 Tax=Robertkochia flava TaxID=3447986 RepID=UPI001CCE2366|nr:glycosyltransferase [Robertkochia marina]